MAEPAVERLSDGIGFATVRPSGADASAQLVELMRTTLRHAQEISSAVADAEACAARARKVAAAAVASTTDRERDLAQSELERLSAALSAHAGGGASPAAVSVSPQESLAPVDAVLPAGAGADSRQLVPALSTGTGALAKQMSQEIETTVMWVQQLLESVHFVDSDTPLDPGASLLSVVQPRLRHQKDEALQRSLKLFNEKKEEEQEFDERAAIFRGQALQAVARAQRERHLGPHD
eukprot:TRINITY_DN74432_c0_g1_i1.p1 TRINITY_DN74432_c0_g1~~TRINITY_DN74432_c0_g1_i1.p1  ORF type:complete len:236 (+),score=73.05 TRINITY_DN74432_c0_g1_i1:47-754(+)